MSREEVTGTVRYRGGAKLSGDVIVEASTGGVIARFWGVTGRQQGEMSSF